MSKIIKDQLPMRLEDKEALIVHALFYINAKSEEFLDSNIMKSITIQKRIFKH